MFDEATWTRENRRGFEVVENLASQAGVEIPSHDDPTTSAEAAFARVYHVGCFLLHGSITVFCGIAGGSRKARRRVYKHMTGGGGARASVMLAAAVGKTVGDEDGSLVREHYQVLGEDDRFITDALDESASGNLAATVICARGIEIASTFSTARSTPPFESLREADWRSLVQGGEREIMNYEWTLLVDYSIEPLWTGAQDRYLSEAG